MSIEFSFIFWSNCLLFQNRLPIKLLKYAEGDILSPALQEYVDRRESSIADRSRKNRLRRHRAWLRQFHWPSRSRELAISDDYWRRRRTRFCWRSGQKRLIGFDLPCRCLFLRMQDEFLHAPVQQFGHVNLVFRGAGDFVYPAELLEFLAGLAQPAQDFSVQIEFVDAARKGIGGVEHLIWSGSDANRPG